MRSNVSLTKRGEKRSAINYFNPKSVEFLAKRAGFKVMDVITPGVLDVDILMNRYR